MKKTFSVFCVIIFILSTFNVSVSANDKINLVINGRDILSDNPPRIVNNRAIIPLRLVCDKLKLSTQWNSEDKSITIKGDNYGIATTINLKIGDKKRIVNGIEDIMDVEPIIIDNVTYIPARYVVEVYNDYRAFWSRTYNTVYICKKVNVVNCDIPRFDGIINCNEITFVNRPSWLSFYKYEYLHNGSVDKYINILQENGFIHTILPSGKTIKHRLAKNGAEVYIGEDLYNWAMFFTCRYPSIIDIENDDYTEKFPNPLLK